MINNKTVLIVDDEESARLYLATIVSELHPNLLVQLSSSPSEALFILKSNCIDLILLDVEMPGMTGLELVENIREISNFTPIIFVSAYKRAEFIQRAIRLNAVDYIDKPVDPAELNNAMLKVFQTNNNNIVQNGKKTELQNDRFCLLTDSGEMFIEVDDILYFRTLKRYSMIYLADGSNKIVRDNLECLSKKLPNNTFLRVSRQHIINKKLIKYVSKSNKSITLQSCNIQITLNKIYPNVLAMLVSGFSLK